MLKKKNGFTVIELVITMLILGILLIPIFCSIWTDGNLDYLFSELKGEPVDSPFWLAVVLSICLNWGIILFNVIIECYKLAT